MLLVELYSAIQNDHIPKIKNFFKKIINIYLPKPFLECIVAIQKIYLKKLELKFLLFLMKKFYIIKNQKNCIKPKNLVPNMRELIHV